MSFLFSPKRASNPIPSDPTTRRSYLSSTLVTNPDDSIQTVADVLPYTARVYGDKTAAWTRKVVSVKEEKKMVQKRDGKEGEMEEKVWKL